MTKYFLLVLLVLSACSHTPDVSTTNLKSTTASTYVSTIPSRGLDFAATIDKVAFASCMNQDAPAPLWTDILNSKPDLFLFMGDNIYGSHSSQQPIAEQYKKLDTVVEYLKVRETIPFLATWDDHDFGMRDGGADWSGKGNAKRDFLNYWGYSRNSISVEQGGVYHAKIVGPKKKSVQVIMLDTRYYRSPLKDAPGMEGKAMDYVPQDDGTVLGDAQWEWLETQLKRRADVRFIVSSIQLIANDPKFEKWGNFPKERQRFFDLLKKTNARNVILLSGDRHIASISRIDLKDYGPLYEITSSSINRPNNYPDADSHYVGGTYSKENFGLAHIDWTKKTVKAEIRGINNEVVNTVEIKFRK